MSITDQVQQPVVKEVFRHAPPGMDGADGMKGGRRCIATDPAGLSLDHVPPRKEE